MIKHTNSDCGESWIDIIECDDCHKKFCRFCDEEAEYDEEEDIQRCGECSAIHKTATKYFNEKKINHIQQSKAVLESRRF